MNEMKKKSIIKLLNDFLDKFDKSIKRVPDKE